MLAHLKTTLYEVCGRLSGRRALFLGTDRWNELGWNHTILLDGNPHTSSGPVKLWDDCNGRLCFISQHTYLLETTWIYYFNIWSTVNNQKSLKQYHRICKHPINWSILPNQKMHLWLIVAVGKMISRTHGLGHHLGWGKLISNMGWIYMLPKTFLFLYIRPI